MSGFNLIPEANVDSTSGPKSARRCDACRDGVEGPFPFSMAFQPIVNVRDATVYAYEALVRGPGGEPALSVLSQVTDANRYAFDQGCRVKAITLAARLGLAETGARLSINFMPGAVYSPAACIQLTLKTAAKVGFPTDRLIFEIVEVEQVRDGEHLENIVRDYSQRGFLVAIDDFGAGYSGMNLLASLPIDVVKLDMALTRNLHRRPKALAIVRSLVLLFNDLGIQPIAEGVETVEEFDALCDCGIALQQGYLFARPAFEKLPEFTLPGADSRETATRLSAGDRQLF